MHHCAEEKFHLLGYFTAANRNIHILLDSGKRLGQGGIKLCILHPYCRTIAPQILSHGRIYMSDNTILAKKHGV